MKANFETNKKICCKCRIEKDTQAFSKDKCTSDGLQSRCKQCAKKVNKENYYFYNPRELKNCIKCGTRLVDVHGATKYCEICRKISDCENRKRYRKNQRENNRDYVIARLRVWRRKNK